MSSVSTFFNIAFTNFVETAKQINPDMRERLLTSLRYLKQNKIFVLFERTGIISCLGVYYILNLWQQGMR